MKKLLLFAVVLLSGCVQDLTVYKHYDVAEPSPKARLYLGKPDDWYQLNQRVWNDQKWRELKEEMKQLPEFQKTYRKYFEDSSEQTADFILKETKHREDGAFWPFALSELTLFVLPTWLTNKFDYSFSLTNVKTGAEIPLANVSAKERVYFGWLMMPMLFSKNVSTSSVIWIKAYVSAIEEAASLVYDPNSRLYRQTPRWTPPVPANQAPAVNAAPVSAPAVAPAKEPSPEDMDMLW